MHIICIYIDMTSPMTRSGYDFLSRETSLPPAINFPTDTGTQTKAKKKNYFISHLYLIHLEYIMYYIIELL